MGLLNTGTPQVVNDDLAEVVAGGIAVARLGDAVDDVAVFVDAQHPVGRDALHGEESGDADLAVVHIGLVVQVLVLGVGGDGGIDLLLASDAQFPPLCVQFRCLGFPLIARLFGQVAQSVAAAQLAVHDAQQRCLFHDVGFIAQHEPRGN